MPVAVSYLLKSKLSTDTDAYAELAKAGVTRFDMESKSAFRKGEVEPRAVVLRGVLWKVISDYLKMENSPICITKIADGSYAAEQRNPDGSITVASLQFSETKCRSFKAVTLSNPKCLKSFSSVGTNGDKTDTSVFIAPYLFALQEMAESANAPQMFKEGAAQFKHDLDELTVASAMDALLDENGELTDENYVKTVFRVSDALDYALGTGNASAPLFTSSGAIESLRDVDIFNLKGGVVLMGKPNVLADASEKTDGIKAGIPTTLGGLKEYIREIFKPTARDWTDEQRSLIVSGYPEDWPISEAVFDILHLYYDTKASATPMLNISYRGRTGIGKSEDMRVISQAAGLPLYVITCGSTTRTEDFLSRQVPATGIEEAAAAFPTVEEIEMFPADVYEQITGQQREDASPDDCIHAMLAKGAASDSGFIITYAAYLLGLMGGGLVEVQEASRIKDPGVLVGLNEFCRRKAKIPLADGRVVERNPDTLVVWTDNIGYESCRKKDPSVKRRFDADIIAPDLTDEQILSRVQHGFKPNPGFKTEAFKPMLELWRSVGEFCKEEEYNEEVPWTDFRNWVNLLNIQGSYRGYDSKTIRKTFCEAITNKFIEDSDTETAVNDFLSSSELKISEIAAQFGELISVI